MRGMMNFPLEGYNECLIYLYFGGVFAYVSDPGFRLS